VSLCFSGENVRFCLVMFMKKFILLIFVSLLTYSNLSFSQTRKEKKLAEKKRVEQIKLRKKEVKDSLRAVKKARGGIPENIQTFPKNFLIKPKYVFPAFIFNVSNRDHNGQSFNWRPSIPAVIGGALRIKKFYISLGFRVPTSSAYEKKYGKTTFQDYYINIQTRIVAWTIYYRDYKGFYMNDYKKFYPGWKQDSLGFPQAKSLHLIEGGMNLGFNFNKNFSLNAAFAQSERQKKSAGSFLMTVSERYQRIETDSNLVPSNQTVNYPNLDKLMTGDFLTTIISLGAGYQFVIGKKFHFTPVVLLGSGIQIQNYQQPSRNIWRLNVPTYANARAQFGYNGDNFFANIIYGAEFNSIPIKESRMRLFYQVVEFGIGVRF
jgi:hypothetical protein